MFAGKQGAIISTLVSRLKYHVPTLTMRALENVIINFDFHFGLDTAFGPFGLCVLSLGGQCTQRLECFWQFLNKIVTLGNTHSYIHFLAEIGQEMRS